MRRHTEESNVITYQQNKDSSKDIICWGLRSSTVSAVDYTDTVRWLHPWGGALTSDCRGSQYVCWHCMYAHDERCVHMHMCDPSPPIIVTTTLTLYPSRSPPSLWCDSFIYNPPSSPDNLQLPVAVMELIAVAAVSLGLLDVERTFLNNCKMGREALSSSSPTVSPHGPQIRRSSYHAHRSTMYDVVHYCVNPQ